MQPKNQILQFLFLLILALLTSNLGAQEQETLEVIGEKYRVIERDGELAIFWRDQPAPAKQLKRTEGEIRLLTPTGEERVLIVLDEAGRATDVVDLKYTDLQTQRERQARDARYRARDARNAARDRDRARRDAKRQRKANDEG